MEKYFIKYSVCVMKWWSSLAPYIYECKNVPGMCACVVICMVVRGMAATERALKDISKIIYRLGAVSLNTWLTSYYMRH
jgi:hypothetical protein